ncbi:uncharacterized protein AB9W97_000770 isoform 1-T2 [Spinachia spinachia]
MMALLLTSGTAAQEELDSVNDLKELDFGQSVPNRSLLLLYWFANEVEIDENDNISLTFDPDSRAYGSHYYGNYEGLLDPLPRDNSYQYYTIGSLNQDSSRPLPDYVVRPVIGYVAENRARIIIRVREPYTGQLRVDRVYVTQHIKNQGEYDPDHTYRVTTNLLREVKRFSVGENQQQLLQLRNRFGSKADVSFFGKTWGELAGLELLLLIVIKERGSFWQQNSLEIHDTLQNNYGPQHNPEPLKKIHGPQHNPEPLKKIHGPQHNPEPLKKIHGPQRNPEPLKKIHGPQRNPEPLKKIHGPQHNPEPLKKIHGPQHNPEPLKKIHGPQRNPEPLKKIHGPQHNPEPLKKIYGPQRNPEPQNCERQNNSRPENKYEPGGVEANGDNDASIICIPIVLCLICLFIYCLKSLKMYITKRCDVLMF